MRAWIIAPAAAAALGLCAIGWATTTPISSQADTYRQLDLFADVMGRVKALYVSDPNESEMIEAALNGMLASLDPHSSYLSPKEFEDMQISTRGEYEGLGLEVTMEDGFVKVVAPIEGTPAFRAGFMTGDLLTGIDGQSILGLTLNQSLDRMRGKEGSSVTITILRNGQKPFDVTLMREKITPKAVTWRREGDVGYIRIATFNEKTNDGLLEAVKGIKRDIGPRLKGVVLDLRGNPGGLLDQAVDVSDDFLDGGEVVFTRGRDAQDTKRYNAKKGELLKGTPVVVLINEGSASASEIVAGALQDRKRAKVVGVTSFGKGSVQTLFPLKGGVQGALRLTTARYYTPSGRSIQATGIEPDVEVAQSRGKPEKRLVQSEADLPGALNNDGGVKRKALHDILDQPPEAFKGDYQLKRALDVVQGLPGPKLPVPDPVPAKVAAAEVPAKQN